MYGLDLDLRYALRSLWRSPAFAVTAIVAIALGIGASTAVFSVLYSVGLRPLPWPDAERIVSMALTRPEEPERGGGFALHHVRTFGEESETIEAIGAHWNDVFTLTGEDQPRRVQVSKVTPGFFEVLRVPTVVGRVFDQEEVDAGQDQLAVLSQAAFRRYLDGDDTRVGEPLRLDGKLFTVIGVLPDGFDFPNDEIEMWVPLIWNPPENANEVREIHLPSIARLVDGVSLEVAQEEGTRIVQALDEARSQQLRAAREEAARAAEAEGAAAGPGEGGGERRVERRRGGPGDGDGERPEYVLRLDTLLDQQTRDFRPAIKVLAGAVLLVFLIGCANVANLLLARGIRRRRELATRAALGAGRRGLVRTLLAESMVLSVIGGAAGVGLAWAALRLVVRLDPGRIPRLTDTALYPPVLLFALGLVIASGVAFGLVPLLQVRIERLTASLGRDESPVAGGVSPQSLIRGGLVVAEVALALMLLIGAGLLANSFLRLTGTDLGFQPEGVVAGYLALPEAEYSPEAQSSFYERLLERVRGAAGIERAALVNFLPPVQGRIVLSYQVEGRPPPSDPREQASADLRVASADYFETMGIPVVAGRGFDSSDRSDAPPRVVINQAMANVAFPDQSPLGERLAQFGEIVGVVGNVKAQGYESDATPTFYLPLDQAPPFMAPIFRRMGIAVRSATTTDPTPVLRDILQSLDPDLAFDELIPMTERLSGSVALPRFYASVMAVFAGLALVLALVGIYGVMSYLVSLRTRETGVRLALGARRLQVLSSALWRGLRLTIVGIVLGLVGAFALRRAIEGMLFELDAADPTTFVGLSVLLVATAALACFVPARRASTTDPATILRQD